MYIASMFRDATPLEGTKLYRCMCVHNLHDCYHKADICSTGIRMRKPYDHVAALLPNVTYGGREGPFQTSNFSFSISEFAISKVAFLKLSFQNSIIFYVAASA